MRSRASRNGTPLPISVSQMMTRGFGSAMVRAASKAAHQRLDVVAVDALDVPAEGLRTSAASGSKSEHPERGAVGLLIVDVDKGDEVVELPTSRADIAASQVEPSSSSPSESRL